MSDDARIYRGSCLCGEVAFEFCEIVGPFELCHCSRCRKTSGSAFVAGLKISAQGFRITRGESQIRDYEAPILERPPAYRVSFCTRCGSPVPHPPPGANELEIHAGLLDDEIDLRPDRHIFIDHKAPWHAPSSDIPAMTEAELRVHRIALWKQRRKHQKRD
jgi:hypothetical protein